ncbi:MAG TPA: hypothetical protein VEU77_11585 [Candidatus Acidoferrales bacterium]|nr:hypothetical protein [Candidatus Acidoferrales bacterium]
MRRLVLIPVVACILVASGSEAIAGPEWCDSGSPPPNDFRFRPTGTGSVDSSTSWRGSTTGGVIDLASGVNTLSGGVAHGMAQALENARPYDTLPSAGK